MFRIQKIAAVLGVLAASPTLAACPTGSDIAGGSALQLTRLEPFYQITQVIDAKGNVTETTVSRGASGAPDARRTSKLKNGLFVLDRRSDDGVITQAYASALLALDPKTDGSSVTSPTTITLASGDRLTGQFTAKVVGQARVDIGPCAYPVAIIRRSTNLDGGRILNSEIAYSHELGTVVAYVGMTEDWKPRNATFFDTISLVEP